MTSIPLVGQLTSLLNWLIFFNTILVGALIFLAHRNMTLKHRVEDLEKQVGTSNGDVELEIDHDDSALDDDRPIPIARHRFGDASSLLKRK